MIGVSARSLNFARGPGGLSLRLVNNFFYNDLWNLISGLAQNSKRGMQIERANLLTINANVVIPTNGCGIREIETYQRCYVAKNTAIVIYNSLSFGSGEPPIYDGRPLLNSKSFDVINILYEARRRHFDTILNLTGAA
ncbi:hypothetical protein TSAR_004318, partial [Trichomalopsis sarcophagae]